MVPPPPAPKAAEEGKGGAPWGVHSPSPPSAKWTKWTPWTLWTAAFGFRVHEVHAVHFVHSSARGTADPGPQTPVGGWEGEPGRLEGPGRVGPMGHAPDSPHTTLFNLKSQIHNRESSRSPPNHASRVTTPRHDPASRLTGARGEARAPAWPQGHGTHGTDGTYGTEGCTGPMRGLTRRGRAGAAGQCIMTSGGTSSSRQV